MAIERRAALTRSHKWVFATQLINHSQLLLQFTVIISKCFALFSEGEWQEEERVSRFEQAT